MFEKVNPSHPDKIADRIAGAITDLAYAISENPKIATEVLIGHGTCRIIIETNVQFKDCDIIKIVHRIAGENIDCDISIFAQDIHLANNQSECIRCGDNGIFKGVPTSEEELNLCELSEYLYDVYGSDGKYVVTDDDVIICQSNADIDDIYDDLDSFYGKRSPFRSYRINPLGNWSGGTSVDSGATNRKLGSDMGRGVTGGGLHGKDLSKSDVSVNIFAFLEANRMNKTVELVCAIGDISLCEYVDGEFVARIPYESIVDCASNYIKKIGGFEKFAEWGLVRYES